MEYFCTHVDVLNGSRPRARKLNPGRWMLLVDSSLLNATCVFTAEERIGGPFVQITITVITNFKAMSARGCEDKVYYY